MSNANTVVAAAIANTKKASPSYWDACLIQRAGRSPNHLGSFFPGLTPTAVGKLIESLVWEPYTHADVVAPAKAFIAREVPGIFGMRQLSDVPANADLRLRPLQKVVEGNSQVELVWERAHQATDRSDFIKVDFAVLLLGPSMHDGDTVWTFHPGDPVRPKTIDRFKRDVNGTITADRTDHRISKNEAHKLGFNWVKL